MKGINVTFTRHRMTEQQVAAIDGGIQLELADLASRDLANRGEAEGLVREVVARIQEILPGENIAQLGSSGPVVRLYGVVPAPIRAILASYTRAGTSCGWKLEVHEAFNVKRSKEGGPPSFEFAGWLYTGKYWLAKSQYFAY